MAFAPGAGSPLAVVRIASVLDGVPAVRLTPLVDEVPAVSPPASRLSPPAPGPAPPPVVSDVVTACVDELDVLLFAADADFVSLPPQAAAVVAIAIEKRIERFIFRG